MYFVMGVQHVEELSRFLAEVFTCLTVGAGTKDPELSEQEKVAYMNDAKARLIKAFDKYIDAIGKPKPQ